MPTIEAERCGPETVSDLVTYYNRQERRRDRRDREAIETLVERDHYRVVEITHTFNLSPILAQQYESSRRVSDREEVEHVALKLAVADFLDSLGHQIRYSPANHVFMHPNHTYGQKSEIYSASNFEDDGAPVGIADVSCGCAGCEIYAEVGYSELQKVRKSELKGEVDCYITAPYQFSVRRVHFVTLLVEINMRVLNGFSAVTCDAVRPMYQKR